MASKYPNGENAVLKIFKFENEKIVYDLNSFQKLVDNSGLGDCEVCVFGILGKLRGGKSFFLNIVRSYLLSLMKPDDADHFLKDLDKSENGFSWRNGEDACTNGIDILNEILVFDIPSKKKRIAIILVDCQGSDDYETSMQADAKLFALSTLFTSIQIYNLSRNISESDLQSLEVTSLIDFSFNFFKSSVLAVQEIN